MKITEVEAVGLVVPIRAMVAAIARLSDEAGEAYRVPAGQPRPAGGRT